MGLFGSRTADRPARPQREPRDIEALEELVANLESATDEASTWRIFASTYVEFYDMQYAAAWLVEGGVPRLEYEVGPLTNQLSGTSGQPAVVQQAVRAREAVYADDSRADDPRMAAAIRAGCRSALALPIVLHGTVIAVLELYGRTQVAVDSALIGKWGAIMRVAEQARRAALLKFTTQQLADDRLAVTAVVDALGNTTDSSLALRSTLDAVRKVFGWAYGSYWEIDEDADVLRFQVESGSAGRRVPQGDPVRDVHRGRRAPRARVAAARPGLRPRHRGADRLRAGARPRNTPGSAPPSASRSPAWPDRRHDGLLHHRVHRAVRVPGVRAALRAAAGLASGSTSCAAPRLSAQNARDLLNTVDRLRAATDDAARVADEAVSRASDMTGDVAALGDASTSIGDVIKVITSIADQTNLLALNATIEAARAGEIGKGFAVVAGEVKELARETAEATKRVSEQIAALQSTAESVAAGIRTTSETIGQMDAVQARIGEVLAEQATMAHAFER